MDLDIMLNQVVIMQALLDMTKDKAMIKTLIEQIEWAQARIKYYS